LRVSYKPILALVFCLCIFSPPADAATPIQKNVLFISEVNLSSRGFILLAQQVMEGLQQRSGYQIEFFTETLSSTAFSHEAKLEDTKAAIVHKFEGMKIDLIVAFGPTPIRFLADLQDTFLPGVPILICGSTKEQAGNPTLGPRFTGAWFELDPVKTVQLAAQLTPGLRHVYVVGGSSPYDRAKLKVVRDDLLTLQGKYDFVYLIELTFAQLEEKLRHLPEHSIVLYTSFFEDAANQQFINATVALPAIAAVSSVPVFGLSDTYIGHGIVGGYVVSFSEQGDIATREAIEVLQGRKPQETSIIVSRSSYMFDEHELKKWKISDHTLPGGSVIVNQDQTLWDRDPGTLITVFVVIAGLGVVTVYLLRERKLLRQATNQLANLSGQLINAQEDERRRLARELHDDFSQRVALLCIGLEVASDEVAKSPENAKAQLQQLMDSAGEIGADLHAMSHRLHSATLERLGLVPGVSALCKEINKKQGLQVEFTHHDVPRSIPSDVALCIFRIVQESLRNVKKHSASTKAWVELSLSRNELHLSIVDAGLGFDEASLDGDQGIGIQSMKERARLLSGQFRIISKVGEGTRVEVSLPLKETLQMEAVSTDQAESVNAKPVAQKVREVSHG